MNAQSHASEAAEASWLAVELGMNCVAWYGRILVSRVTDDQDPSRRNAAIAALANTAIVNAQRPAQFLLRARPER
jgi:hypothetical protein